MRLLLDTHVLIWWDEGARVSKVASDAIRAADLAVEGVASGERFLEGEEEGVGSGHDGLSV